MASRKDQLHSYQFLLQRVVSALIMRETDPAQAPLRRGVGAVFVGVMIAVIVAAGYGVYGLLTKVGTGKWKVDHAVVIERETGAAFVYSAGSPPTLTPVLNYTSALLLSGQAPPTVFRVARRATTGIRRDIPRGIPGAPGGLPDPKQVTGTPWSLCTVPGSDLAGNPTVSTQLAVGHVPGGGRALGDDALLVSDSRAQATYLIWHSHRYHLLSPDLVVPSLFGAQPQPVPVGTAWINGVPAGRDIGLISVPGQGLPSAAVSGHRIGDLLFDRVGTGDDQYYVVLSDGLAAVSVLQKDILVAQSSATPAEASTGQVNQAAKSTRRMYGDAADSQPPYRVPRLAATGPADRAVCAESADARSAPQVVIDADPHLGAGTVTGSQTPTGTTLADLVAVPAGRVAVVEAMASPNAVSGPISIVTDVGVRFPVPSIEVLNTLGYPASAAVPMPASLVNRIPVGPTLTPTAAAQAAAPAAPTGGS
jgi:type VII secretion protein EccB